MLKFSMALLIVALFGTMAHADLASENKEFLAKIAANYDCYYGDNAETTVAAQSVIMRPSCATGNLCVANVYCRQRANSKLVNFVQEFNSQIVCNTKTSLCPSKASACISDVDVAFATQSGNLGDTYKANEKRGSQ